MAGDWIKMRIELQSHPKIVRILSATKSDKFRVVGGLHAVWSVFDTHSVDGKLAGYTPDHMDHVIGWPGFSAAMVSVGWLIFDGAETLGLPEFDEHNGKSAKRRAEDQKRKRNSRKGLDDVRDSDQHDADNLRKKSGLDKREDIDKEKIGSPSGKPVSRPVEIDTWLGSLPEDQDPIPVDDPIIEYAEQTRIPQAFLQLAWDRFAADYRQKHKRQKDWPAAFRNAVRGNWYKLWWFAPDGSCQLTTAGEQAKRAVA